MWDVFQDSVWSRALSNGVELRNVGLRYLHSRVTGQHYWVAYVMHRSPWKQLLALDPLKVEKEFFVCLGNHFCMIVSAYMFTL